MSLPPSAADVRASALGLRWGFPNNYTFSKHLAEQLVDQAHQQGLPVCIVRPSLVCAVLYEPIPGHIVSVAGLSTHVYTSAVLGPPDSHGSRCVFSSGCLCHARRIIDKKCSAICR
jgi:nucleoside-diphosphate-sugar epimerase